MGMLGLTNYIGKYNGGPIDVSAWAFGALIALGPLATAVGDTHTFDNGFRMGIKTRAFLVLPLPTSKTNF
jgi:hypothetical protein